MGFDLVGILYTLPGIIIGLTFHEFAHAQTAVWLGDDTPRLQGRTSLNPLAHLDIIGFIMILIAHFGWAKPVQINPLNFEHRKRDDILVSLAGPVMNILLACLFLILMKVTYYLTVNIILDVTTYNILITIFDYAAWINIVLCIFNLLPIPPLDGSHIIFGLAGQMYSNLYYQVARWSTFIFIALIIFNVFGTIIIPPVTLIYNALKGIIL